MGALSGKPDLRLLRDRLVLIVATLRADINAGVAADVDIEAEAAEVEEQLVEDEAVNAEIAAADEERSTVSEPGT